jgi:N-acetylmuramoyl-L-alanine amidase
MRMAHRRCIPSDTPSSCRLPSCLAPARGSGVVSWRILLVPALATLFGLAGCVEDKLVIQNLPGPVLTGPVVQPPPPPPPPPPTPTKTISNRTIVVDAGHGGKDPGALAKFRGGMREKDINLDIANQVSSELAARGARVIMTRRNDTFLELDDRANFADRYRADLFLSIHVDSSPKRDVAGTGIHIFNQANYETTRIAQCIYAAFRRNGITCRGIVRNNFAVLREHHRPGVLIECGYLTNVTDSQRLNDRSYRSKVADAIADGIADHFSR